MTVNFRHMYRTYANKCLAYVPNICQYISRVPTLHHTPIYFLHKYLARKRNNEGGLYHAPRYIYAIHCAVQTCTFLLLATYNIHVELAQCTYIFLFWHDWHMYRSSGTYLGKICIYFLADRPLICLYIFMSTISKYSGIFPAYVPRQIGKYTSLYDAPRDFSGIKLLLVSGRYRAPLYFYGNLFPPVLVCYHVWGYFSGNQVEIVGIHGMQSSCWYHAP